MASARSTARAIIAIKVFLDFAFTGAFSAAATFGEAETPAAAAVVDDAFGADAFGGIGGREVEA
jgi:hypothetical protein